jgi:hypothetical protein
MATGFGVTGLDGLVNIIGKAILNLIAVCLLAWFWLRLRRRHDPARRPRPARQSHDRAAADEHHVTKPGPACAARPRGAGPGNTRHRTRGLGELTDQEDRRHTRGLPALREES